MTPLNQCPVEHPYYFVPSGSKSVKVINSSEEVVFVRISKPMPLPDGRSIDRFVIASGHDMSFVGPNGAIVVEWVPGYGDGVVIAEFDTCKYPQYPSGVHNLPPLL